MTAGGDIHLGKAGGADGSDPSGPNMPSADMIDSTGADSGMQDNYVREPAAGIEPGAFGRVLTTFGNIVKFFFPDFFGIFGRVNRFIPEYAAYSFLESASGAQFFYRIDEDKIALAGNLYDISSFIHKYLDDPRTWSMGSVVSIIRDDQIRFESGKNGVLFSQAVYNHSALMFELSMRPDPEGDTSIEAMKSRFKEVSDLFGTMDEYEIEESVLGGLKYTDVVSALNRAFRGVRPRHSEKEEMMITMKPPDAVFGAGLGIGRVDAGMRLAPDGTIRAMTFRILDGKNEALWIGRISADHRVVFWEVENSNPGDADRTGHVVMLNRIAPVFKPNIKHVLTNTSGAGDAGGTPSSSGQAAPAQGQGGAMPPVAAPPTAAMSVMMPVNSVLMTPAPVFAPMFLPGAMQMVR